MAKSVNQLIGKASSRKGYSKILDVCFLLLFETSKYSSFQLVTVPAVFEKVQEVMK